MPRPPSGPRASGPALEAMYQLLLWLVPTLEKFLKSQKFQLGDRLQSTAMDVLDELIAATFTRGRMGQGIPADAVGGSLLWRLAAAHGDTATAFNLGAMLKYGIGLLPNPGWARFYYDMAAQAGHPQAREALRRTGQ